ncbi:MMPL family transporter [Bacillus paramycoides]|uniref:MMPL family transporter n=1 Tax=Bacillus paramycoides TaxID=2026194 RepID=UPI002E235A30|nr:MMPL family transporter [Bacillus paramycoides]MED1464199.1 MMPL family transporter [Bacillus paramycoides]MED1495203.1 MMPL family transporter [Bacillus paramycoides]
MAKYLYKLGHWAVNHRKKVVFSALAILIALVLFAVNMGSSFKEELSIPNTPADKAGKVIEKEFKAMQPAGAQVKVVFQAPKSETLESAEVQQKIAEVLDEIKKDSAVDSVAAPMQLQNLSEDKTIGYAVVTYKVKAEKVTEASKNKILDSIETTRDAGIQTELSGGDIKFSDSETSGMTEIVGVLVAFVVLAFTFVSFLAAGLPILTAIIGLAIGMLGIMIGTNYVEIQTVSLSLAAMLGLAVGIDYALFIINRFRQQLAQGDSVPESVAIATGTAGSAVIFAGLTVIIGLLGLSVTKIPFLTAMGVSAAFTVFAAVLVSIIILPAILGFVGHKIAPSKQNRFLQKMTGAGKKHAGSNKWGEFVIRRPLIVTIFAIGLLAVITIPFFHMNLGLPSDGTTKSTETTERRAYDLLTEAYGEGFNASLVVVARSEEATAETQNAMNTVAKELGNLSDVKSVRPAIPGPSGKIYMISVTPKTGPDDTKTKNLVKAIRDKSNQTEKENGIELMVTGPAAMNIDIVQKLSDALPVFAALIVGLAYVLLVLVFRSLLIPLKAVLGFLLSLGATLGAVVFFVQDGHFQNIFGFPAAGPILAFLPVILIGILFGLAMDYEVFLVSKMREVYTHTGDPKRAILEGMRESGRVVVAAGLIMMSVFIGFMLAPDTIIKSIGMALTFGVFFDAFIVRMTIVPAVMTLMGKSAWYLPKWLDKILPNIDVEGESIIHHMENKSEKIYKQNS